MFGRSPISKEKNLNSISSAFTPTRHNAIVKAKTIPFLFLFNILTRFLSSFFRKRKKKEKNWKRVMGVKKGTTPLEIVIEKAGGCAVVDGGFATQLERHGAAINDPLWSALCLIKQPDLIKQVSLCVSVFVCYCCSSVASDSFLWIWVFYFIFRLYRFIWNTCKPVQMFWSLRLTRFSEFFLSFFQPLFWLSSSSLFLHFDMKNWCSQRLYNVLDRSIYYFFER